MKRRDFTIYLFIKIWTKRFLIAMEEFEKLKIIRFLSHLDSLDGRYAWWVKDKSE
ncbi:MAG: hypothetical protein RXR43_09010 [Sulfolobus sp.]